MNQRDKIAAEALSLSPEDRIFVADKLESSLSQFGFATQDLATAWSEEIERRVAAYDRGEIPSADSDEVMARLRRTLTEFRVRNTKP